MRYPAFDRAFFLGFIVISALIVLVPMAGADDHDPTDLEVLTRWMTGNFSTAAQAAENPEFFDINLHVAPIWSDRTDGLWLYVEQAMAEYQDRPYRQRVYRLREPAPGLFEIQVFTLPDPTSAIGAWLVEDPLADLEPIDLDQRDGCAILLRRRGETFIGSTLASLCTSTLRGASYASSEVVITPEGLVSWDRGFAADGIQVWGATKGGYVFDRIVPDGPESESVAESVAESESESESESDPPPDPDPDPDPE